MLFRFPAKCAILVVILFSLCSSRLFAQAGIATIKVAKEARPDSAFFDRKEFALYSKTSGYTNRFKTVKKCTVEYISRRKSGKVFITKNQLPGNLEHAVYHSWCKKIEIKLTGIVLRADSMNPAERNCPPITITVTKRLTLLRFLFGRWGIITPIPTYKIVRFDVQP